MFVNTNTTLDVTNQYGPTPAMELDTGQKPFRLSNPWGLSIFSTDTLAGSDLFPKPDFDFSDVEDFYLENDGLESKLPELEGFQFDVLEDLDVSEESVVTEETGKRDEHEEEDVKDIWSLDLDDGAVDPAFKSYSWEAFTGTNKDERSCSAYLSEAGLEVFDAALQLKGNRENGQENTAVVRGDVFVKSLFALGLGRSSMLFRYDTKTRDFIQTIHNGSMSGYSLQLSQSLISAMSACGRNIRHLRDFVDRTYVSSKAFPARVALANAISSIIDAVEQHLTDISDRICTLLEVQEAFERPSRILREIYDVAKAMRNARSNEEMASFMFKRCQNCEQQPEWLRSTLLQVLARTSRPWLEIAEQWVGFEVEVPSSFGTDANVFATRHAQEKAEERPHLHEDFDSTYHPEKLPTFISYDDGQMLFETGRGLRTLQAHRPEHPLALTTYARKESVSLEWKFDWQDAERVVEKAKQYEKSLVTAIRCFEAGGGLHRDPLDAQIAASSHDSVYAERIDPTHAFAFAGQDLFQNVPPSQSALPDELFEMITTNLASHHGPNAGLSDFSPPSALAPVLSFNPFLSVQNRLVNAVMIRMFFRTHHLRNHLNLQRSFHLLGDGVFVTRVTAALFDPNLSTTERQLGVMRSGSGMGLRLGSRGAWPPASSELRLALMGILGECYEASFMQHKVDCGKWTRDLPGNLSFAIRHLTDNEAGMILDADSLHALDFLRLQYSPPQPLGAVLTPSSLERYDTIFKFLLRLMRLLFVVAHLPIRFTNSKVQGFRVQAEHFVSTCCKYFFDTGVMETWNVFMSYLDGIEKRLDDEDRAEELGTTVFEGIDDLRKQHDLCLDRITFALLLRNRQQKVMAVLEEILTTILEFSKLCNREDTNGQRIDEQKVAESYQSFNAKVKLFLDVCKGLIGKKGYGKPGGEGRAAFGGKKAASEENTIERLVAALDFNGFYGTVG